MKRGQPKRTQINAMRRDGGKQFYSGNPPIQLKWQYKCVANHKPTEFEALFNLVEECRRKWNRKPCPKIFH